ncbi:MAG: EamA family transporter [Bacteroidia bacterium]|nr:EamA family transporter [Bacteroidia bacterium]
MFSLPSSAKKQLPYIALAFVCVFWGTTYLAMRVGLRSISPYWIMGLRNSAAGIILVSYFLFKGHKIPTGASLRRILITGIIILFIGGGLQAYAVQFLPSGLAALIFSLVPFWILLINLLINPSEKTNATILSGLALGFAGQLFVFLGHLNDFGKISGLQGLIAIIFATLFWSLGTVYGKKKKHDAHPLFAAGIQMFVSGFMFDGVAFFSHGKFSVATIPHEAWIALVYLTVVGSLMGYSAYIFALSKLTATEVSVTAYVNPIIAIIAGTVLLGEEFTVSTFVALALTVAGVILINKKIHSKKKKLGTV